MRKCGEIENRAPEQKNTIQLIIHFLLSQLDMAMSIVQIEWSH